MSTQTVATVPTSAVLVTMPSIELIHAGTWDISTGAGWEVTPDDLAAAVASQDCPAVRRPVLKLGHTDPRFDGEPAVGWVDALATTANGTHLVGDYVGVPGWLAEVMASAYPDRSVEGSYDFRCQLGHTHPFVLTAVALLGVTPPGVGTLASLQDVAALYGIAASEELDPQARTFSVAVNAGGRPVPQDARGKTITASVSTEDVRNSFYNGPAEDRWSWWIEQVYVDPAEVIVMDDAAGTLYRVPYTITGNEVEWGEEQEVRREYVAASSTVRKPTQAWATRAESRPGAAPAASADDAPAAPAAGQDDTGGAPVADEIQPQTVTLANMSDEQLASMRQALDLPADATTDDIATALVASVTAPPAEPAGQDDPPAPTPQVEVPEGFQLVEASTLSALQRDAEQGRAAAAREQVAAREQAVAAAITDGRIAPAQRAAWTSKVEAEGASALAVLASLPKGLIPTTPKGHDAVTASASGGDPSAAPATEDIRKSALYQGWKG